MDKTIDASEERRKIKYNFRNNLILTIDENERIKRFNEISEDLSGFNKAEVLNKKPKTIYKELRKLFEKGIITNNSATRSYMLTKNR